MIKQKWLTCGVARHAYSIFAGKHGKKPVGRLNMCVCMCEG